MGADDRFRQRGLKFARFVFDVPYSVLYTSPTETETALPGTVLIDIRWDGYGKRTVTTSGGLYETTTRQATVTGTVIWNGEPLPGVALPADETQATLIRTRPSA